MVYLSYGKKLRLMMRVSGSDTMAMPVAWRRKRLPRLVMPWRLPTTPCFTLPEAVKRKRFLAPLLVFILGIFVPFQRVSACARVPDLRPKSPYKAAEAMPLLARPLEGTGLIAASPRRCKRSTEPSKGYGRADFVEEFQSHAAVPAARSPARSWAPPGYQGRELLHRPGRHGALHADGRSGGRRHQDRGAGRWRPLAPHDRAAGHGQHLLRDQQSRREERDA